MRELLLSPCSRTQMTIRARTPLEKLPPKFFKNSWMDTIYKSDHFLDHVIQGARQDQGDFRYLKTGKRLLGCNRSARWQSFGCFASSLFNWLPSQLYTKRECRAAFFTVRRSAARYCGMLPEYERNLENSRQNGVIANFIDPNFDSAGANYQQLTPDGASTR